MNWRYWIGQFLLARARRHELRAAGLKKKAEKFFQQIKGGA